jgi:hypothetical protein
MVGRLEEGMSVERMSDEAAQHFETALRSVGAMPSGRGQKSDAPQLERVMPAMANYAAQCPANQRSTHVE